MDVNQNEFQTTENGQKEKKNHLFLKGALFGALLMFLAAAGMVAGGVFRLNGSGTGSQTTSSGTTFDGGTVVSSETETKLELLRALADRYYLYDIDDQKLLDGIYKGFVDGLNDEYTVYYNEEETKELLETTSGVYCGIGAVLTANTDSGQVQILSVYKDSPADKAGMKADDILVSVDGKSISGQTLSEVVSQIKGEEGTQVKLEVSRNGKTVELTATKAKVEARTVEYEMKDAETGYLQITEFDDVTLDQYEQAMEDLKRQGMKRLVIDLRSNPGGNLDTVCDILKTMLPEGVIVYTEDKNGTKTEYKNEEDHTLDIPLVVLVNGMSASASEIFTGAVQDYGIGTIVGTKTYGKGVVQQLVDLQDGTYLKITISEYFTPKGRSIQKKGIEPDVTVEYEKNEQDENADNQLEKALEIVKQK